MKFFKEKEPFPISKFTFRKHLRRSLLAQFFIVGLFSFFIYVLKLETPASYSFLFLILINILVAGTFFDLTNYRGRFKDIYPRHNVSMVFLLFLGLVPPMFIAFTIFLCLKDSWEESAPPKLFYSYRYASFIIVPLIALQFLSPSISYWTSIPTHYFINDVTHDAINLINYKKVVKRETPFLDDYKLKHSSKLNSTELVLLTAVAASKIAEDKNKKLENGFLLLKRMHELLAESEKTRAGIFDFSPIHWLTPSGPTEILLLSMVETRIIGRFSTTLVKKSLEMIEALEGRVGRMPAGEREVAAKRLNLIKSEFQKTSSFSTLIQEGISKSI